MDSISSLLKYQESVIESLEQENSKWTEGTAGFELQKHVEEAKAYYQKLLQIQQDVLIIQEKTNSMKKRAFKLQQEKERQALDMEQRRQKRQETDKKLSPVIRLQQDGSSGSSSSPLSSASSSVPRSK